MSISADTYARAIIAAARVYGDGPLDWAASCTTSRYRRSLPAACSAIARVCKVDLPIVCRPLGISDTAVRVKRNRSPEGFPEAEASAMDAVRYGLRMDELQARAAAKPQEAPPAPVERPSNVTPLPRQRSAPAPARGRQIPRGARIENLRDGVQVIKLKPVTDSITRHARAYVERGMAVDEIADLFDVSTDALLKALGMEASA